VALRKQGIRGVVSLRSRGLADLALLNQIY